jgi:hypothetical protein
MFYSSVSLHVPPTTIRSIRTTRNALRIPLMWLPRTVTMLGETVQGAVVPGVQTELWSRGSVSRDFTKILCPEGTWNGMREKRQRRFAAKWLKPLTAAVLKSGVMDGRPSLYSVKVWRRPTIGFDQVRASEANGLREQLGSLPQHKGSILSHTLQN